MNSFYARINKNGEQSNIPKHAVKIQKGDQNVGGVGELSVVTSRIIMYLGPSEVKGNEGQCKISKVNANEKHWLKNPFLPGLFTAG